MLFSKLLPREGNFFEMFNQHADRIVEAAHAFSKMVANYSDVEKRSVHTGKSMTPSAPPTASPMKSTVCLHKTFITPIDRDQIHQLINTMDDVADLIQDSAETMALYDVRHMTEDIVRLTDLSVKCCERLQGCGGAARQGARCRRPPKPRSRPARKSTSSSPTPTTSCARP